VTTASRESSAKLKRLENSLKNKLLSFYNKNIKNSLSDIIVLKQIHDTAVRNIIRKTVQDSYLHGTDLVGQQVAENNPSFDLFISQTDLGNIQRLTDDVSNQFWTTSARLQLRESTVEPETGQAKKSFDITAAMIGIASFAAFGAFNNAVRSKLPAATAAANNPELTLDIGFEIKPLVGRVRFTTQHDAKVDLQICDPLDGMEWDADSPDIVVPPQDTHPHCRCSLIPIVESG
jgi:hypothetical protein